MNTICTFGLGEAGTTISSNLLSAGISVQAYDPAPVITPAGVSRSEDPGEAVLGVDAILALTAASDIATALAQSFEQMPQMHTLCRFFYWLYGLETQAGGEISQTWYRFC